MLEGQVRTINQLLEEEKGQEALSILEKIVTIKEEDSLIVDILKIHIFSLLERLDDALNLLPENLFVLTRRFHKHGELIRVIIIFTTALRKHDRLVDALSVIEKGEAIFNRSQTQDKDQLGLLSNLLSQKGALLWHKGALDEAFSTWQDLLEINKTIGNRRQIGSSYNNIGMFYWSKGDLNIAEEHFKSYLNICQELGLKDYISRALNNIGMVKKANGELDVALDYYQRSVSIQEELGNKTKIGRILNNIGEIFRSKGELDTALDYYKRSIEIRKDSSNKLSLTIVYDNIGSVYFTQGDLDLALKYYKMSLPIRESIGNHFHISYSFNRIGLVYRSQGDYTKAHEYFTKALSLLAQYVGNEIRRAEILFNMVVLAIDNEKKPEAKRFLDQLGNINAKEDNRILHQQYQLAKAAVFKDGKRLSKRIEAQNIFSAVSKEKIVDHELTVYAMLNLSEMLLFELRVVEEKEEVLTEIKSLVEGLLKIAKNQNSYSLLVHTYFLQSKLALLELDVHRAELLLTQARFTAEEKGLWRLELVISSESDALRLHLKKWNELKARNASFLERLELSQVNQIVKRMIQSRVEDVSNLPQFAIEKIKVSLFKMAMSGPKVAISQPLLFTEDEHSVLHQMALLYIVSLGQGQSAEMNKGLFGPLPIPNCPDHVGIAYAFFIKDPEYTDPRCQGTTYAVLVFSIPRSLGHFFRERERISSVIERELESLKEINEINLEFLQTLKNKVIIIKRNVEHQEIM